MKKNLLLACSFCFCILFSQAQNFSGALTSADGKFNRPDEGAPPTALSTTGTNVYYDVIPLTITTAGLVTITCITSENFDTFGFLYGTGGFNPSNPLANVLVGDDDSGPGVNFGFTYNFTAPGTYYVVVSTFKNLVTGTYTVATTEGGILPVKLTAFTAEKAGSGKNLIKWTASGEINIVKYQVQHSSDGNTYTDIDGATINARNLPTISYYTFTDNGPFKKFNFYRLKITDNAGKVTYSIVAVVDNSKTGNFTSLKIFPNPAANYINIQTKTGQKGKVNIYISSASGQTVYKGYQTIADAGIINLDVEKLSAGNYFVRLQTDGETTVLPFVKINSTTYC